MQHGEPTPAIPGIDVRAFADSAFVVVASISEFRAIGWCRVGE